MKVFLGGTYKDDWRLELTKWIVCEYEDPSIIEFNSQDKSAGFPKVIKEISQKKECGILLHLFTGKTKGYTEIVSATMDVLNNPQQTTISIINEKGLNTEQRNSLTEFAIFAKMRGCKVIVGADREQVIKAVALNINNESDNTKIELIDNWQ